VSMNLYCENEKHETVDLISTPTNITAMCLYDDVAGNHYGCAGSGSKKSTWQRTRQKYLLWVTAVFGNELQQWDVVDREREELMSHKRLKFGGL